LGRTQIMVIAAAIAAVLLGGCSQLRTALDSSAVTASPPTEMVQAAKDVNPSVDVQNQTEKQLVMIFHGLLRMDRQTGLAITKKQAGAMLPYVRKSIDEGSLNESDQKQVMNVLTAEQKSFLEEQFKQIKTHTQQGTGLSSDELSAEEREKKIDEFKKRRIAEHQETEGNSAQAGGGSSAPDGKSTGKSVEQQLIELLESK
jgi:hypothetical protein